MCLFLCYCQSLAPLSRFTLTRLSWLCSLSLFSFCTGTQRWQITCRRRKQCWMCSLCCWTAPHWSSLWCSTVMSGRTNLPSYSDSWLAPNSKSCTATCTTVHKGVCVLWGGVFFNHIRLVFCEYVINRGHDPKTSSHFVHNDAGWLLWIFTASLVRINILKGKLQSQWRAL